MLTGSIQPNAMLKVRELGLADRLDLGAGGYENGVYSKAALLELARTRAGERHGTTYPESATVYVADSPRDVQAAHIAYSPIIAVATGSATEAELRRRRRDGPRHPRRHPRRRHRRRRPHPPLTHRRPTAPAAMQATSWVVCRARI